MHVMFSILSLVMAIILGELLLLFIQTPPTLTTGCFACFIANMIARRETYLTRLKK